MAQREQSKAYREFLNRNLSHEDRLSIYSKILSPDPKLVLVGMKEGEAVGWSELWGCRTRAVYGFEGTFNDFPSTPLRLWELFKRMSATGAVSVKSYQKVVGGAEYYYCMLTDFGEDVAKPLSMRGTKLVNSLLKQKEPYTAEQLEKHYRLYPPCISPEEQGTYKSTSLFDGISFLSDEMDKISLKSILPISKSMEYPKRSYLFYEIVKVLYENQDKVLDVNTLYKEFPQHRTDSIIRSLNINGMVKYEDNSNIRVDPSIAPLYEILLEPWCKLISRMESLTREDRKGPYIYRDELKESEEYKTFVDVYDDDGEDYSIDALRQLIIYANEHLFKPKSTP